MLLCMPEAAKDVFCLPEVLEVMLRGLLCMLEAVNGVLEVMRCMLLCTLEAVEAYVLCWSCWRPWRVCSVYWNCRR